MHIIDIYHFSPYDIFPLVQKMSSRHLNWDFFNVRVETVLKNNINDMKSQRTKHRANANTLFKHNV